MTTEEYLDTFAGQRDVNEHSALGIIQTFRSPAEPSQAPSHINDDPEQLPLLIETNDDLQGSVGLEPLLRTRQAWIRTIREKFSDFLSPREAYTPQL